MKSQPSTPLVTQMNPDQIIFVQYESETAIIVYEKGQSLNSIISATLTEFGYDEDPLIYSFLLDEFLKKY